jgi:hypothetical protein
MPGGSAHERELGDAPVGKQQHGTQQSRAHHARAHDDRHVMALGYGRGIGGVIGGQGGGIPRRAQRDRDRWKRCEQC